MFLFGRRIGCYCNCRSRPISPADAGGGDIYANPDDYDDRNAARAAIANRDVPS
jgi:hypothetical protein